MNSIAKLDQDQTLQLNKSDTSQFFAKQNFKNSFFEQQGKESKNQDMQQFTTNYKNQNQQQNTKELKKTTISLKKSYTTTQQKKLLKQNEQFINNFSNESIELKSPQNDLMDNLSQSQILPEVQQNQQKKKDLTNLKKKNDLITNIQKDSVKFFDYSQLQNTENNIKFHIRKNFDKSRTSILPIISRKDSTLKFNESILNSSQNPQLTNQDLIKNNHLSNTMYNTSQMDNTQQSINQNISNLQLLKIIIGQDQYEEHHEIPVKFNKIYKKLDRIIEQNKILDEKQDHIGIYDMLQSQEKQNFFPNRYHFIGEKIETDSRTQINFSNQFIGNRKLQSIGKAFKDFHNIENYNFKNNAITTNGASFLTTILRENVKVIDLSKNKIGDNGAAILSKFIGSSVCNIINLNLESNKLGEKNINVIQFNQILLQEIVRNGTYLEVLNLSDNLINDNNCYFLSKIIFSRVNLKELYLHWNIITSKGADQILENLQYNLNLIVLDLSWNFMDEKLSLFNDFLENNATLVHLDVSNNKFTYDQCIEIREALMKNKTLFGFHFQGLYGQIDQQQFLKIESKTKSIQSSHIKRIQGVNPLKSTTVIYQYQGKQITIEDDNICWICDNYCDFDFNLTLKPQDLQQIKSQQCQMIPVFLHIQSQNFQPLYVGNLKTDEHIESQYIIKNQDQYFFFTQNYKVIYTQDDQLVPNQNKVKNISIKFEEQTFTYEIQQFNFKPAQKEGSLFGDEKYKIKQTIKSNMNLCPRIPLVSTIPSEISNKNFVVQNSIFAKFYSETPLIMKKCCQKDYLNNKAYQVKKLQDQNREIRDLFIQNYKIFYDAYIFYSSQQPKENIFTFNLTLLYNIVKVVNLYIAPNEVNQRLIVIMKNYGIQENKTGQFNLPKTISRPIFIEFFQRLYDHKQYTGALQNQLSLDCFKSMISNYQSLWSQYDTQNFRETIFFTKENQMVIENYTQILTNIYQVLLVQNGKNNKSLDIDDIHYLCTLTKCQILEPSTTDYHINMLFLWSKQPQIDENSQYFNNQLNYTEFIEFICRLAHFSSPPQLGGDKNYSLNQRKKLAMHIKFEGLCMLLLPICNFRIKTFYRNCTSLFDIQRVYDQQQ